MKVRINKVKGQYRVYYGRNLVGTLRKFCCGIDFRHNCRPNALFSILKVRFGTPELTDCLKALLSIKIPISKSFHWNFEHDIAINDNKLNAYEKQLNEKS